MQSDFFQSSEGDAVENPGLSPNYFVAESVIIPLASVLQCILSAAKARVVWHFPALESQLQFHYIFHLKYSP